MVCKTYTRPDFAALSQKIDPQWIAQALAATGKASVRKRKLPAQQVVWLVIALAMYRHQSISQVVADLDLALPDEVNPEIAKSALTQARQRLGEEPLAQLFELSALCWDERHQQGRSWRGLARYAIDGSTLKTPDTEDNREHFGAQVYSSGATCSYPQLRLLTLTSLSTHLLRDAVFGEYGKNEMRYCKDLLQSIPDHSLTVFDKGFLSADILVAVQHGGTARHWIIPAKGNTKWERLAHACNEHDYRVRMKISPQARKANPALEEYWEARAICTTSARGQQRILLTSLLDANVWPAHEIVQQYAQRWNIETSYREFKQEMLGSELTLRSGNVSTVRQEVWGALLAYNLIRLEMAEVAREEGIAATDLSFTVALNYMRYEWTSLAGTSPGLLPKHLLRLRERLALSLLPKKRRGRHCPRVVKKLPARYPVKTLRIAK